MNETNQYETSGDDDNSIIGVIDVNKSYWIKNMEVPILQNTNMNVKKASFLPSWVRLV